MGNQISNNTLGASASGVDVYIQDLKRIQYERSLNTSRFLRGVRARAVDTNTRVVVKVFIKPDYSISLKRHVQRIQEETAVLREIGNALPYARMVETERAGYLVRQHLSTSLYDRISTRPFLGLYEKKWLAFQLLTGLRDAHAAGVCHGDIKTENVLCTSWAWAYLSDWASFKPVWLPVDDPSDFTFFFDSSARGICYLAPERFFDPVLQAHSIGIGSSSSGEDSAARVTERMDVFSMGCVIAELFLEAPLFTLSNLLKYRSGEHSPAALLDAIECPHVAAMVRSMIQLDPGQRLKAQAYLTWDAAFPAYFGGFLHGYLSDLLLHDGDVAVRSALYSNLPPFDARIERIYGDFDKLSVAWDLRAVQEADDADGPLECADTLASIQIPNFEIPRGALRNRTCDEGAVILVNVVCASLRNLSMPSSKAHALELLATLGLHLRDAHKLERVAPYLVSALSDEVAVIRGAGLRLLDLLLCSVSAVGSVDGDLFTEYLAPHFRQLAADAEASVRLQYAQRLPSLCATALRFAEQQQQQRRGEPEAEINGGGGADASKAQEVREQFAEEATTLLTDAESVVRRAVLAGVPRLCALLGGELAASALLGHLATCLNDGDWQLRCDFLGVFPGLAIVLDARAVEQCLLPLLAQALGDAEESVVVQAVATTAALAAQRALRPLQLRALLAQAAPLVYHPNRFLRAALRRTVAAVAEHTPRIDYHAMLHPLLRAEYLAETRALRTPLSRAAFVAATPSAGIGGGGDDDDDAKPAKLQLAAADEAKIYALYAFLRSGSRAAKQKRSRNWVPDAYRHAPNPNPRTVFLTPGRRTAAAPSAEEAPTSRRESTASAESLATAAGRAMLGPNRAAKTQHSTLSLTLSSVEEADSKQNPRSKEFAPQITLEADARESASNSGGDRVRLFPAHHEPPSSSVIAPSARPFSAHHEPPSSGIVTTSARPFSVGAAGRAKHLSELLPATPSIGADTRRPRPGRAERVQVPSSVYSGDNATLRALLEEETLRGFPAPLDELGERVAPLLAARSAPRGPAWAPAGVQPTTLREHRGDVAAIAVAPDHAFFATASRDGTVKVWDSQRLERNVTVRSRLTLAVPGGATCCAFVRGRHALVSGSALGTVAVSAVEYAPVAGSTPRYGGARLAREYCVEGAAIVSVVHQCDENADRILIATSQNAVVAWDLRRCEGELELLVPLHYGAVTCMELSGPFMLLLGTASGTVVAHDLRFSQTLCSFRHFSKARVTCIRPWPADPRGRSVLVATADGETTLWDIGHPEGPQLKEIWSVKRADFEPPRPAAEGAPLFAAPTRSVSEYIVRSIGLHGAALPAPGELPQGLGDARNDSGDGSHAVHALAVAPQCDWFVAGGADRRIRFYHAQSPQLNRVLDGSERGGRATDFHAVQLTHQSSPQHIKSMQSSMNVYLERSPDVTHEPNFGGADAYTPHAEDLHEHRDAISSLAVLCIPGPFIISGSRDGVVKLWK